jgi:mannose-6-phosphate isomerase-like protein (cupin superfamily)
MAMSVEIRNLFATLAGKALDPAVGIRVEKLSGEEAFSLFGAEIAGGTRLSPHFHKVGPEIYYIVSGTGRMSLGDRDGEAGIAWKESFPVSKGDCFTVKAGQVHQLENTGDAPLNALFGCPASHLSTDRTVLSAAR